MSEEGMKHIVDMILEGDEEDLQEIENKIITESNEERILRNLGDSTFMNYLLKFEEYLDNHDIYLFDGWEEARVIKPIKVGKFWAEFLLVVGKDTDLRGAIRLMNDKEGQNKVQYKELDGGKGYVIKFKVLKRYLEAIEKRSKEKAEQLADEQLEQMF